jgi:hypothetical protein
MNNFDNDEKELLDSFERNEWRSVKDLTKRKRELEESARATIRKGKYQDFRARSERITENRPERRFTVPDFDFEHFAQIRQQSTNRVNVNLICIWDIQEFHTPLFVKHS